MFPFFGVTALVSLSLPFSETELFAVLLVEVASSVVGVTLLATVEFPFYGVFIDEVLLLDEFA